MISKAPQVRTTELRLTAITVACLLAGCASYQSAPLTPAETLQHMELQRLDDPALAARVSAAVPRGNRPWPPACWDRSELLAVGLALNPDSAEARSQMDVAVAAATTARALPNPTISLGAEHQKAQADARPWLWSVSTSILLNDLLQRQLRAELADRGIQVARLTYAGKIWSLRRDLRAAMQDLLIGEREARQADGVAADSTALATVMAQRVAAGEAAPGESFQARLAMAKAQQDQTAVAQKVLDARARLARAAGIPIAALNGAALCWNDIDSPLPPDPSALTRLREQALLGRADLDQAVAEYGQRELELQQQVRNQYPQFSLGPGYTWDHGVKKITFGVSFDLPVFNQNQGPIAEAEARRTAAGRHIEAVQAGIMTDIDASLAAVEQAFQALNAARAQGAAAEEDHQRTERGFAAGAEDRAALLGSRLAASVAAQTQLAALDQTQQALGRLEDALMTPLDDGESWLGAIYQIEKELAP